MRHKSIIAICCLAVTTLCSVKANAEDPPAEPPSMVRVAVYTANIPATLGVNPDEMERIAREKGSIEVFVFPEDGSPETPIERYLVRFGEPGFAYPGLTVSIRKALNDSVTQGLLRAAQTKGVFKSVDLNSKEYVECRLPESAGQPLTAQVKLDGELRVAIELREVSLSQSGDPWPSVLRMTTPGKGDIIRVYDYAVGADMLRRNEADWDYPPVEAALEILGSSSRAIERSRHIASVSDDVDFPCSWEPVDYSFDSGYVPSGSPVTVHFHLDLRLGGYSECVG